MRCKGASRGEDREGVWRWDRRGTLVRGSVFQGRSCPEEGDFVRMITPDVEREEGEGEEEGEVLDARAAVRMTTSRAVMWLRSVGEPGARGVLAEMLRRRFVCV